MTIDRDVARRLAPVGVALIALLATVGGCTGPATVPRPGPGVDTSAVGPYRPDDVALRVAYVDGFIPVEFRLTSLPVVSVYGDGRVITRGPTVAISPRPALPNILVQRIDASDVVKLATRALAAGVGSGVDLGPSLLMDAPITRFTVLTNTGIRTTGASDLDDARELTPGQRARRQALRELLNDLTDLSATLGPDAVTMEQRYRAEAVAAVSRPWTEAEPPEASSQPEKAWPGPALPTASASPQGLTCMTITGTNAAAVLDAAASANERTPWISDGRRWLVGFRPLLPDETSCDNLTPRWTDHSDAARPAHALRAAPLRSGAIV
jgi:hypothetical protein